MPHLDASALTTDPEGLSFLKGVLNDAPADRPVSFVFDVALSAKRKSFTARRAGLNVESSRRKRRMPEAV